MKIKIRRGTFETNSSSAHTCILVNDPPKINPKKVVRSYISEFPEESLIYSDDGRLYLPINTSDFGSDFAIISDWEEKLQYVIASIYPYYIDKYLDELISMFNNRLNLNIAGFMNVSTNYEIEDAAKKILNQSDNFEVLDYEFGSVLGWVDHQSSSNMSEIVTALKTKNPEMSIEDCLFTIIFDPALAITTDSDSGNYIVELIECGVIDELKINSLLSVSYPETTPDGFTDWDRPNIEFIDVETYMKRNRYEDDEEDDE